MKAVFALIVLSAVLGTSVPAHAEPLSDTNTCEQYAELHYAMAESAGLEGPELDEAYEDAVEEFENERFNWGPCPDDAYACWDVTVDGRTMGQWVR